MDVILGPLFKLVLIVLELYMYVVFASVIMSWLYAFNIINTTNKIVYMIGDFLYRATEPALRPIRRFMPNLGGLDISPIILLLAIWLLQDIITRLGFRIGVLP